MNQILLMDAVETGLLVMSFVALVVYKSFSTSEEDSVRYDWVQVNKEQITRRQGGGCTHGPRGGVVACGEVAIWIPYITMPEELQEVGR